MLLINFNDSIANRTILHGQIILYDKKSDMFCVMILNFFIFAVFGG